MPPTTAAVQKTVPNRAVADRQGTISCYSASVDTIDRFPEAISPVLDTVGHAPVWGIPEASDALAYDLLDRL